MQEHFDLESLEKDMWPIKKRFLQVIEPYRSDLWMYCRSLTGSTWDAEDLVQETLMKALASLGQIWQPLSTKPYLFRIATNTWLNQIRRNKITFQVLEESFQLADTAESPKFDVHLAIELLVQQLPPRQTVILLLIDVFDFTARETGEMLSITEGAVKAALHRARTKLKSMQESGISQEDTNSLSRQTNEQVRHTQNRLLIDAFIDAFNRRDPDAMVALLDENATWDGVHVGQEYGREVSKQWSIADDFKDPDIDRQRAEFSMLWGRPVVLMLLETETGPQLNDIVYLDTEEDKITFRKHYYFCFDLLSEAAVELGIPLQSGKSYKVD